MQRLILLSIRFVVVRIFGRFNLFEELPNGPIATRKYSRSLLKLFDDEAHESVFLHIYENLTILDAKSGSLLQFNSVLMAIFAIFIAKIEPEQTNIPGLLGILLALISSLLLLQVVWVHWSTSDHMQSSLKHMTKLLSVRKTRTICYRIAWNFSQWAGLCLVFIICRVAFRWATH